MARCNTAEVRVSIYPFLITMTIKNKKQDVSIFFNPLQKSFVHSSTPVMVSFHCIKITLSRVTYTFLNNSLVVFCFFFVNSHPIIYLIVLSPYQYNMKQTLTFTFVNISFNTIIYIYIYTPHHQHNNLITFEIVNVKLTPANKSFYNHSYTNLLTLLLINQHSFDIL